MATAGCSSSEQGPTTVALLLSDPPGARYAVQANSAFRRELSHRCSGCKATGAGASGDPARQRRQAKAAVDRGAELLVVDPVDEDVARAIGAYARREGVAVIGFKSLFAGLRARYYVGFDRAALGQVQGATLRKALRATGDRRGVAMINTNDYVVHKAAHVGLGDVKVVWEGNADDHTVPALVRQLVRERGRDGFGGIHAANDRVAAQVAVTLESLGIDPRTTPVTGNGADLAAMRRLVAGDQYMTAYEPARREATVAAKIAARLAQGDGAPPSLVDDEVIVGNRLVPVAVMRPLAVTVDTLERTVIADRYWRVSEICSARYAATCRRAGLHAPSASRR